MKKMSQPRIKGVVREPGHTALLPEMAAEVKRLARMHNVSESWVRATLMADQLGKDFAKKQPKYYIHEAKTRRNRRRAG